MSGRRSNWDKRNREARMRYRSSSDRESGSVIMQHRKQVYPERWELPPRKPLTDSRGKPITLPRSHP